MCNDSALASIFGQFSGREIAAIDSLQDPPDPVFAEMHKVAQDNGYALRFIWNDRGMTTGYDPKRANVHMERLFDGKWRVGTHFHAG
jgi:hypothetical protein